MKGLVNVLVIIFVCIGCSEKQKPVFLQEQQVAMTPPRVQVTSAIIDSSVIVTAHLGEAGTELLYTEDGTDPTKESLSYRQPITVYKEGVYRFKAFHSDWKSSDITTLKLYKKGYVPSRIDWHTLASDTYPGKGASTLINGQKAALSFRDSQWLGFDTLASATVIFKEQRFIKTVTIGYLIDADSWIFPPEGVTITINEEAPKQHRIDPLEEGVAIRMEDIIIPIEKEVSSLKITLNNTILPDWHVGKGAKAWLFMDEWIFN